MSEGPALPRSWKIATVWLVLAAALFVGVQWFLAPSQRTTVSSDGGLVELRRARDGHFHWRGQVNGVTADFLIDTGATTTTIPKALADRLNLPELGSFESQTANGSVRAQWSRADLTLEGGVVFNNLRVAVLPELETPLLGMNVLSRLALTQEGDRMRLQLNAR